MAWHGRLVGDWHGRLAQGNVGRSSLNRRFARAGARIQVLSFLMREAINGNQHAIRDDQGRCANTSALILARPGRSHAEDLHALVLLVVVPRGILGDHPAVLAVDLPSENRRDMGDRV